MKISRKAAAVLGAAAVAASPLTAFAAAPSAPVQGSAVSIGDRGMCTIGYNDRARGVSYLAGHCGYKGDRVRLMDAATGQTSRTLGTFYPSEKYDASSFSNDWGVIKWDRGVKMGANIYSGETIIPLRDVKAGDEVCHHGETTHQGTSNVNCGPYYGRLGQIFAVNMDSGRPGDSGGPLWVKGKGFIGVASATGQTFTTQGSGQAFAGAAPKNGQAFTAQDLMVLTGKAAGTFPSWYPLPETIDDPADKVLAELPAGVSAAPADPESPKGPGKTGTPPTTTTVAPPSDNSSASSSDSSDRSDSTSSSSEMSDLQIAMIVISVLVTVLPIIAQLAQSFL